MEIVQRRIKMCFNCNYANGHNSDTGNCYGWGIADGYGTDIGNGYGWGISDGFGNIDGNGRGELYFIDWDEGNGYDS
jgi:hypothetical protein